MKKFVYTLVLALIIHCTLNIENCSAQWQPDVRLTNNPAYSYTSGSNTWSVAANGNVIHIVWADFRDGKFEIYYKRSTDAGVSWGTDTRLTNNNADDMQSPSVTVSGSFVHVVWCEQHAGNYDIYYKRSIDAGISWGAQTQFTTDITWSTAPSLAVTGSVVNVVWNDNRDGNWEIYYKRSTDAGVSWGTNVRLTNDTTDSEAPSVAVSGQIVHVAWLDEYYTSLMEIYYKRSTDGGVSWGTKVRLTFDSAKSLFPCIAVSGSDVHVVWYDQRDGNREIYYKRSTDVGITWGVDTRLTNNTSFSKLPSVAVSGSVVHIVWEEERDGNQEIYYKRSTDAGITWGADTRLTNNTSSSEYPSVAVYGSVVHVVWEDTRDGVNPEIYYKRNPTGNVGIQNISTETPSKYSLSQNYPNPFNPITNVKFSIVNTGEVKLTVYDIVGREVQTLVNERLQPGTYEASFDGSTLNSGVYFYKLITDGFKETKRMILIK